MVNRTRATTRYHKPIRHWGGTSGCGWLLSFSVLSGRCIVPSRSLCLCNLHEYHRFVFWRLSFRRSSLLTDASVAITNRCYRVKRMTDSSLCFRTFRRFLLWFLRTFYLLEVKGLEHIPATGPV